MKVNEVKIINNVVDDSVLSAFESVAVNNNNTNKNNNYYCCCCCCYLQSLI